ncbi:MAG TPA: Stp1/IreP family PP2C-type Ser/Thr phosphatase [Gaiellaceae bacterium]|nr:Stp1/IreP family PP2C-type Ser/Thr phosphatase [Gaiellaceae bacterium]
MNIGVATHPGRKRRHNEDSYVVEPPMFAVADGMGGAKAGEVASGLAADALKETGTDGRSGEERVTQLIQEANRRVFRRANEDREASGMGTTMTVALVEDGRVVFGHVGDSRAYLIREGSIEQLTDDHSLVAELVRSGRLTPEEAEAHPQRSVITRAVGTEPDVDVDTFTIDPEDGDLFLICSDGLTDMVDDGTIIEAIERNREDLDEAAKALVGAANRVGGEDNITVLLVEVGDTNETSDTARAEAVEVDEDTLSGLEAVPAVDTAVVPPEEAAELAEAEPPKRRGRALPIVSALAVLLIAAAAVLWLLENM